MFLVYVLPVWNNQFNFRKDSMCEKIWFRNFESYRKTWVRDMTRHTAFQVIEVTKVLAVRFLHMLLSENFGACQWHN